eukprot:m.144438 g.144438  ORF g.144438 m.144438 type:complete len:388 (+) comp23029_c0_seq1:454-1617(+)
MSVVQAAVGGAPLPTAAATSASSQDSGPASNAPTVAKAKFKKKKKRGTTREPSTARGGDDVLGVSVVTDASTDGGQAIATTADDGEEDISSILAATREEQHYRRRAKGISTVTLATGEKVTQEQEVEMAASGGGWTANKGGIMPKDAAKDRDRDRTGEDSSVVKGLNNVFTATQDVDFQDAEMQRYVEEQMMVRSGQPEEEVDTRTDYDKRRQELFEVPEEYRDLQAQGALTDSQSRGLLSNAMLSGIPEVDLGVDSKFQNVQRVEQARHLRETAGSSQQGRGQKDPVAQGDGFLNYGRARFLTSSVQDKRAMGSSKGVVNVPGQELSDHTATFEAAKKKAFDRGVVDTATYSAHPEKVVARGRGRHRDGASDDQAVNKFRKKTRRY